MNFFLILYLVDDITSCVHPHHFTISGTKSGTSARVGAPARPRQVPVLILLPFSVDITITRICNTIICWKGNIHGNVGYNNI